MTVASALLILRSFLHPSWSFLAEAVVVWNAACLPVFPKFVPAVPRLALLQDLDLPSATFLLTEHPRALFLPHMKLETSWPAEGFIKTHFPTTCPCLSLPKEEMTIPQETCEGRLAAGLCHNP